MRSFRYSVNQRSLEQLEGMLPAGWRVEKHWPANREWYIGPHSKDIVSLTNGTHSIWLPDQEHLHPDMAVDEHTPVTQNPIFSTWNPFQHSAAIHEVARQLDRRTSGPRVAILTPWYLGERTIFPHNVDAQGYTMETTGNAMLIRSPLTFVNHLAGTLRTPVGPMHERGLGPVHDLRRALGLHEHQEEIQGARHLDDLSAPTMSALTRASFGTGPQYCSDANHHYLFGIHPEGTHITGAKFVGETVNHEAAHTDFYENFNRDLPEPVKYYPRQSPYGIRDLLDLLVSHNRENQQNGRLWDKIARVSPLHKSLQERGKVTPGRYIDRLSGADTDTLKMQFDRDPQFYLTGDVLGTVQKTGQSDPLSDSILAAANTTTGARNLQELWATAKTKAESSCGELSPFERKMADRFGWKTEKSSPQVREAGLVNPSLLSPCTGDKNCGTCAHFDELIVVPEKGSKTKPAKPLTDQQKKQNQKMLDMKTRHQEARI